MKRTLMAALFLLSAVNLRSDDSYMERASVWLAVGGGALAYSHLFAVRAANADKDAGYIRDQRIFQATGYQQYFDMLREARAQEKKAELRRQYANIFIGISGICLIGAVLNFNEHLKLNVGLERAALAIEQKF